MNAEEWIVVLIEGPEVTVRVELHGGGEPYWAKGEYCDVALDTFGRSREDVLGQLCCEVGRLGGKVVRVRPRVEWTSDSDGFVARNGDFLLRVVPVADEFRAYVIESGMPTRIDTRATPADAKRWAETALYEQLARRAGR